MPSIKVHGGAASIHGQLSIRASTSITGIAVTAAAEADGNFAIAAAKATTAPTRLLILTSKAKIPETAQTPAASQNSLASTGTTAIIPLAEKGLEIGSNVS